MATSTIKGLTIKIGADTQKFNKAIKNIDTQARTIAKDLKTVSESLKIDPGDAESFADKMKLLKEAVNNATTKVESIKQAISKLNKQFEDSKAKQDLYKQSVSELEQALKDGKISQEDYNKTLKAVEDMYGKGLMSQKEYDNSLKELERQLESATYEQNRSINALDQYQRETSQTTKDVDKLGDEQKETNKEIKNFKSNTDNAEKSAKSFGQSLKEFLTSDKIKGGFTKLVGFIKDVVKHLANAGKELYKFSKDAVSMAASYEDALGYSETVFGKFAESAQEWVVSNSERLRIYKGDLLEYTNSFGQVFKTQGLAEENALEMAKNLISLSADIRAATGRDTTEINELLQRGFTSSLRNFRSLGVVMSEASVKAYALENGLVSVSIDQTKLADATLKVAEAQKKATDALNKYGEESLEYERAELNLTKAEEKLDEVLEGKLDSLDAGTRSTAIYMMLMESLANIVGQNEREAGLYNSQLELAKTKYKNLKETIGEQLLPVFTDLLTKFNEFTESEAGQKTIQSIVDQFTRWGKTLEKMVEDGSVEKFFSDMSDTIPQLVEHIGDAVNKIIEIMPEIEELAEKILNALGIETESTRIKKAYKEIQSSVEDLAKSYGTSADTIRTAAAAYAEENGLKLLDIYNDWETYEPLIKQYLESLNTDYIDSLTDGAYDVISQFAANNLLTIQDITGSWEYWEPQIKKYAESLGKDYNENFTASLGYIQQFATDNGVSLQDVVNNWSIYEPQINTWLQTVSTDSDTMAESVKTAVESMAPNTQTAVNKFGSINWTNMDSFRERVRGWKDAIIGWFNEVSAWAQNPGAWKDNLELNPPVLSGNDPLAQYADMFRASGGEVSAGRLYRVNDDAGHRTEWFLPSKNGYILNGDQTERLINNVNNSRTVGDLYINVYTQSATMSGTGEDVGEAVLRKLRISGVIL